MKAIQPRVQVLLSSGFSEERMVREMIAEGIVGFVKKPVRIRNLSRLVGEILERRAHD